jgi:Sulfotransferase family
MQLANVYERVNRPADAQAMLQPMLAAWITLEEPMHVEIRHQQANLALRNGDAALARSLLENAGPRNPFDYDHYFALAKVYDKLGDRPAMMQALYTAHARQIEELKHAVPFRFEPGAPILPAAEHRVTATDYRSWPQLTAPDAAQSPIFIVGYPRSGTTLLEQMLDAHPRLQSMDERPFFNTLADQLGDVGLQVPQDLHKLNQRDCDELRKAYLSLACSKVPRRWDAQLVDKNPLNMLWLPMIHRLFPRAKFILALRHPCDVILSNYMQNFRSGVLATASANLETLAKAYVTAMNYWLHHVEVFQPDLLVSRYEDLVDDPAAQTARIAQFLGLDDAAHLLTFDQRARDKGFIATPSYTQVIEPVNRKGLDRWQRYRDYFEPALPILQPILQHWGYSSAPTPRPAPASSAAV